MERRYKENVIERNKRLGTEEKIAEFRQKQSLPYKQKVLLARKRVEEFEAECATRGLNTHVSVGGLDSITLVFFLRSMGVDVPAISVSILEDKSIQKVHREIGVEIVKPIKTKAQVIEEFGFPVLSKETAGKIALDKEA